ncbi:type VI secretion system tube protein TssD [Pseudomonas sp. v388]|uniref:type VI secretion system tube protein TssD n=1 Tax=Pseudomonas sp. v388 TaxID=2479849 RepID=UPI0013150DF1|nr:type VI secretion system tube protein TssD [Pseudomonas sp. v388]
MAAYMSITNSKGNVITQGANTQDSIGTGFQSTFKDQVLLRDYSHQVQTPSHPHSGQPTGRPIHEAFCVTAVVDRTTPLLMEAANKQEVMPKVEFNMYRVNAEGVQECYFTVLLEDAVVSKINQYMEKNNDLTSPHSTDLVDVAFSYRKIVWDHHVATTTGSHDHREPAVAG